MEGKENPIKPEIRKTEGIIGENPSLPLEEWREKLPIGCHIEDIDIFLGGDGFYHWRLVINPEDITDPQERKDLEEYEEEKRSWTEDV